MPGTAVSPGYWEFEGFLDLPARQRTADLVARGLNQWGLGGDEHRLRKTGHLQPELQRDRRSGGQCEVGLPHRREARQLDNNRIHAGIEVRYGVCASLSGDNRPIEAGVLFGT